MSQYKAYLVSSVDPIEGGIVQRSPSDLPEGYIRIRSQFSSINYKDALAITGKGRILKKLPLVPGIDVVGEVVESKSPLHKTNSVVVVTAQGLGEDHDGGLSEFVTVPGDHAIGLPKGLTARESMILGTAGFTAALCLHRMLENNQTIAKGPIAVTGASGGVEQMAINIFSQQGFEVIAISGKSETKNHLLAIGATQVCSLAELELGSRPLEKARFGGAIDNVGGTALTGLMAHIQLWGNIACVGLAESHELKGTVMPLILRGVSLLGISSNNCEKEVRRKIWENLAGPWKPKHLEKIFNKSISLEDVSEASWELINRKNVGRIIVEF